MSTRPTQAFMMLSTATKTAFALLFYLVFSLSFARAEHTEIDQLLNQVRAGAKQ